MTARYDHNAREVPCPTAPACGIRQYRPRMRHDLVLAGGAGAALAAVVLLGVDAARPDSYVVTAKALSAAGAISAEGDGWTYSIPMDVAWQDARGEFHESGRPDCLPPSGKEEGPVRFKAVPVDVDGLKFRQVIYVECMP